LPRTLRAPHRKVSGREVCDERQQFRGKPRADKRILLDNQRQPHARQQQQAVDEVRGDPQPPRAGSSPRMLRQARGENNTGLSTGSSMWAPSSAT
jgi:hypothetical protein